MNKYKYGPIKMTPFKWFCLENFPFIEEDFDSLTSYGLWCKLKQYFDKVANNVNSMGIQVESLTNAFNVLKDYVDNYFTNLDVQDEINNKLDEMVQDGTLERILLNYSKVVKIYNTHQDMINDVNNMVNNMKVKTLGYYNINDGGSAEYYINNIQSNSKYQENLGNGLFANLIYKDAIYVEQLGAHGDGLTDDINFIQNAFNTNADKIILSKNYYVSSTLIIANKKEICGNGKIIVPSFESNDGKALTIFRIESNNTYVHDLFIEANATDKIPYLNIKAGLTNGVGSNRVAFTVAANNVIIENINTKKVGSFSIINRENIYINNCNLNENELAFYIDNSSGKIHNINIEQNSNVDSEYYHPFYIPQISNILNLENIKVDVVGNGIISDVLHIFNSSYNNIEGGILNVNNLEVVNKTYPTFMQINNSKANLNNIKATVVQRLISLASNNTVVTININNSRLEKTEEAENSVIFTSNNNVFIDNSTIVAINSRVCSNDIIFNNCKFIYSKKFSAGFSGSKLTLKNCYILSHGYTRLVGLNGNYKYINCYFLNTDLESTVCQYNANESNVGYIMDCIFENVTNIIAGTITNIPISAKYYNPNNNSWNTLNNLIA